MSARLVLLGLAGSVCAFGAYTYDYSGPVTPSYSLTQNGTVDAWGPAAQFNAGGSLIWNTAVTSTPNDYEVNTTLALAPGGGTYINYLRASSNAEATPGACAGSYVSLEIVVPTYYASGGTLATLNMNQCTSGSHAALSSFQVAVLNGSTFRTVVYSNNLLVYLDNQLVVNWGLIPSLTGTTGQPGLGGYGMSAGSGFTKVAIGRHDVTAPNPVVLTGVRSSLLPSSVSLAWQGTTDDTNGVGVAGYYVTKGVGASPTSWTFLGLYAGAEIGDRAVSAATTYTYLLYSFDFHGNNSAPAYVTVTTPPATSVDPRRVGVFTTGSYWGGGGEQIDMLSGNLNFSLPLLTAQGRTGWKVPVGLSYNSQNWRQDSGTNWELGTDVGYGYGWSVQIGSVTPYYLGWPNGVDHYVYTDGTGAQYTLTQIATSNVWTSAQGIYVWFDANTSTLHFKDGTFWLMGCVSSGAEQDAGTMYPTVIEDVNGNQVTISYQSTPSLPTGTANTSGRIVQIVDSRATNVTPPYPPIFESYSFTYNTDPIPHLTTVTSHLGTSESYTFSYNSGASLGPPFGSDPTYAGLTTTHLASITPAAAGLYQFTYDTAGASELQQVTFPLGGHLRWNYSTANYAGSRSIREISNRYLAADSAGATEWTYPITHSDSGTTIASVHADATIADASGIGSKTWTFTTSGSAWQIGLPSNFYQNTGVGGTALTQDTYSWSQTPSSNPYISTKVSVTNPGTGSASAQSTQTLDAYGNVAQAVIYPYNNTTTPLQTFTSEYITDSGYEANYIRNRLLRTRLTLPGGTVKTLQENYYDGKAFGYQTYGVGGCMYWSTLTNPAVAPSGAPTSQLDPNPLPFTSRGLLLAAYTANSAQWGCSWYYSWGVTAGTGDSTGNTTTSTVNSSTGYSLPSVLTSQTYSTSLSYNSWLGLTQTTGPNGETMSMTYDGNGRPLTATSPYGTYGPPTITYEYSASGVLPAWQTKTGPDGYTKTTLDGLGRAIKVERGPNSTTVQSETDTVYAPCACSPMAKLQKTSTPYAPGGTPAWTTYVYDGTGRTVSTTLPDGASTTTYAYAGNTTTVTDPAGNSKTFTSDVLGNLTMVSEPNPAGGTLTTSYTYDYMKHLNTSTMTRGSTTQTRTFVYNDAGLLTSATNPENGTVTYTYNANNTLQQKLDANGQYTNYGYDSNNRVIQEQHLVWSPYGGYHEDTGQRVTYTYDSNPINPYFSQYAAGRLTTVQYGVPSTGSGFTFGSYTEMYSYHPAGGVTVKEVQVVRPSENDLAYSQYYPDGSETQFENGTIVLDVNYTYDSAGRRNSITYPQTSMQSLTGTLGPFYPMGVSLPSPVTYTTTYDSMGRPLALSDSTGVSWASGTQYDLAGRMTSVQYPGVPSWYYPTVTETMSYNVNGQMASRNWTSGFTTTGLAYSYSATQNNGQITQMTDTLSGETVAYQYDALKRLTSAASTPNAGSTPAAWTQTYQYDGFGNLTAKVLNGTTTPISVDPTTNRLSGTTAYDANGNLISGGSNSYDGRNRLSGTTWPGYDTFVYDASNHRVFDGNLTLYGAYGERLATYGFVGPFATAATGGTVVYSVNLLKANVWFNGRNIAGNKISEYGGVILPGDSTFYQDRVGTDRSGGARYRPYGEEITSTSNDRVKFGTYIRDWATGMDYADQRYYASSYGRFNTADQYGGSVDLQKPGSWNRYAYVGGDPINHTDPTGQVEAGCESGICIGNDGDCNYVNGAATPACDLGNLYSTMVATIGDFDGPPACLTNPSFAQAHPSECGGDPSTAPVPPPCEEQETDYLTTYLLKYNSPLANFAGLIVQEADAAGIDDRFIVALAGAESIYGKTQQASPTWGYYNAFSNAAHCQALSPTSDCYAINPYSNYAQAITGAIDLLTGSKYFGSNLVTVGSIYKKYNRVPAGDFLATIYGQLVPKATVNSNVDFSRCP